MNRTAAWILGISLVLMSCDPATAPPAVEAEVNPAPASEPPKTADLPTIPSTSPVAVEFKVAYTRSGPGLVETRIPGHDGSLFLEPVAKITDENVQYASLEVAPSGRPKVYLTFDSIGGFKLRSRTQSALGHHLAIVLDGEPIIAPRIEAPFNRRVIIEWGPAGAGPEEAQLLVTELNRGFGGSEYTRVRFSGGDPSGMTRVATFRRGDTRVVLAGAVHVGECRYFEDLQRALEGCDIVLCEGAGSGDETDEMHVLVAGYFRFYEVVASTLDVCLQAESMTTRPGWVNVDMPVATLNEKLRALSDSVSLPVDPTALAMLEDRANLDRKELAPSDLAEARKTAIDLFRPRDILFENLGEEKSARLEDVLIRQRNDLVIEHLERVLVESPEKTIGILYGAAHLSDFESRLTGGEMGFELESDRWLTGLALDPQRNAPGTSRAIAAVSEILVV